MKIWKHFVPGTRAALLAAALLLSLPRPALADENDGDPEKIQQLQACQSYVEQERNRQTAVYVNKPPGSIAKVKCVILGAGFAGTQAFMHLSGEQCLVIESGAPQGIQQGLDSLLQKRTDVKFVPPVGRYTDTWQPTQMMAAPMSEQPLVSVAALEAARACNARNFGMKSIRGVVSKIQSPRVDFVSMTVQLVGRVEPLRVEANYVIIATGAGSRPAGLRNGQYEPIQKNLLYETKFNRIPLVQADVQLMSDYRDFPAEAKQDTWILSGTNAGAASVAAFLLQKGVPAGQISMIGKPESLNNLLTHFGSKPEDAYFQLNQAVNAGDENTRIKFLDKDKQGTEARFAKVKLNDTRDGILVSTDASLPDTHHEARHFVHAFNMESDVDKLFDDPPPQIQAESWFEQLPDCSESYIEGTEQKTRNIAQVLGDKAILGLRMIQDDAREWPVFILGAATTTLPKSLQTDSYKTFLEAIDTENSLLPSVYTRAAIPYWAPKLACGAQLIQGRSTKPNEIARL